MTRAEAIETITAAFDYVAFEEYGTGKEQRETLSEGRAALRALGVEERELPTYGATRMKIATLNIKDHGAQTVDVPRGARMLSAVLLGGVVQVNYSFEDDIGATKELADLMVVHNNEDFPADYDFLDTLVDPQTKQVSHVLYREGGGGGDRPVATPV